MAWLSVNYNSKTMKMPVELEVLLPQSAGTPKKSKVLFLLHGAIGDKTSWLLRSQITFFASKKNVCVVMPSGKNYCYVNTVNGYHYMDFICEELPRLVRNLCQVSDKREDWMIAGCSMGGYGAVRCGLHRPDLFGYVASFSGAVDMVKVYKECDFINMQNIFGSVEELAVSDNHLENLMTKATKKEADNAPNSAPKFLVTCGEEDDLYQSNLDFYQKFCGKFDMKFLHKPGGHDWDVWNDSIGAALEWFYENDSCGEVFGWQ